MPENRDHLAGARADGHDPPMSFLKQAIKAVPQVRWALAVLGVASAASLLFGLFANRLVAIAGTVAMLLLMVVLLVFARGVATLARTSLKIPALFLMWSAMILAVSTATLAMSSLFFNEPITRQELLSLQLSDVKSNEPQKAVTELSFTGEVKPISLDRLRPEMLQKLPTRADDREIARSLAQNGSLTLKNSCLVIGDMTSPSRTVALSVRTLALLDKACIITNGNHLELTVVDLLAGGGTIRSFDDPSLSAPSGSPGANGHNGGSVSIRVLGRIVGPVTVDLRGQNGGSGGVGQVGAAGVRGPRGSDASSGAFGCQSGGSDGGRGGPGGQGEPGFSGGDGGDGGNLTLIGGAAQFADQITQANLKGGDRGPGGEGGAGGPGGMGGEGGSGSAFCGGGHGGETGPTGPKGPPGSPGEKTGAEGKLLILPHGA
jgi:hypothetical protein